MVFGIDLGTTNSLIGSGDILYTGLVSSTVNLETKECVGRDRFGENIIASYKTNMGLSPEGEVPIFCSSVVLKELADRASRRSGVECKDVCISVPAYFATTQREAVKKAAEKAGLNVRRIINEPTAAAIYVCKDVHDFVVVYDLGGGTFDVTIIDTRDGMYRTIATDGEVLGGDDLDFALVDFLLKKYNVRLRYRSRQNQEHLRVDIRLAKEHIQKTKTDAYVDASYLGLSSDMVLTVEDYKQVTYDVFAPTITKTIALLDRYVPSYEKPKIIYTGGSTYCPYLHELLGQEIGLEEIKYASDKDKLVAHGIAYIAELVENGCDDKLISNVTKRLSIEMDDGHTKSVIEENTMIPCTERAIVMNSRKSDRIYLKLYQGNEYLAKDNDYIGEMEFNYGHEVEARSGYVNVDISVTYEGIVILKAWSFEEDEIHAREIKLQMR